MRSMSRTDSSFPFPSMERFCSPQVCTWIECSMYASYPLNTPCSDENCTFTFQNSPLWTSGMAGDCSNNIRSSVAFEACWIGIRNHECDPDLRFDVWSSRRLPPWHESQLQASFHDRGLTTSDFSLDRFGRNTRSPAVETQGSLFSATVADIRQFRRSTIPRADERGTIILV